MQHIEYAHNLWSSKITPQSQLIDATLGNGHDTLFLAQLLSNGGRISSYDIQPQALQSAEALFKKKLTFEQQARIELFCASHTHFSQKSADLIVYNLGYLPGGNKELTTVSETTLQSLCQALDILNPGGLISITLYPGHREGAREKEALLAWADQQAGTEHITFSDRASAPSLLLASSIM